MDLNNCRPANAEQPPPMGGDGDWRSQLQADSRQKIVNKIMETLKKHTPVSGLEGLDELERIAIRFEVRMYNAAISQSDYLRKISLKMLTMESKSQNTIPNAMPGVSRNPQDPGVASSLFINAPRQTQDLLQANQSQQQLMSQPQSQATRLEQLLGDLQQKPNVLQHIMQQLIQNLNSLRQQQNMIDLQLQRASTEAPPTSLNSTAQSDGTNAGDWQEETYQKTKAIKDLYLPDLNEMYLKIYAKLLQYDALPRQPSKSEQLEKLRMFKHMLGRLILFLQTPKNNILPNHRDKLPGYEKQIIRLLNA